LRQVKRELALEFFQARTGNKGRILVQPFSYRDFGAAISRKSFERFPLSEAGLYISVIAKTPTKY